MKSPQSRSHQPQTTWQNYSLLPLSPYSYPQCLLISDSPTEQSEKIQTPDQQRRRAIQIQTMNTQKDYLRDRLYQRILKASQQQDTQLIYALQQEWQELFPDTPCILSTLNPNKETAE